MKKNYAAQKLVYREQRLNHNQKLPEQDFWGNETLLCHLQAKPKIKFTYPMEKIIVFQTDA